MLCDVCGEHEAPHHFSRRWEGGRKSLCNVCFEFMTQPGDSHLPGPFSGEHCQCASCDSKKCQRGGIPLSLLICKRHFPK